MGICCSVGLVSLIRSIYGGDMTPSSFGTAICVRRPESVAFGLLSDATVVLPKRCIQYILLTACWRMADARWSHLRMRETIS